MIHFAIVNSQKIELKNLHFDYDRPTMSELTFERITNNEITALVNPSSKFKIEEGRIKFYGDGWTMNRYHSILTDTTKKAFYYSKIGPLLRSKATQIAPHKVRFTGNFSNVDYNRGQVLSVRDPIRDQVGAFIAYSNDVKLYSVHMHYMHGMGIISQFTENITLEKVSVAPRKETGRQIAAFADCFHFSGCKGQITIKNCKTYGAHDDAVNIHGTHLQAIEMLSENKINLLFRHKQTYGMKAFFKGDSLNFLHPKSLEIYGTGVVKKVDSIDERVVQITLKEKLPSGFIVGDVVENTTWTPRVLIENNYFSGTNTRGILLTTRRKSIIRNNTFYRTGMHAILIADDAENWFESGPVTDVEITGNTFIDCGYNNSPDSYVINIWPENRKMIKDFYVHRNIRITNNLFKVFDTPVLRAKSTEYLVFSNNTIEMTNTFPELTANKPSFYFVHCKNVELSENQYKNTALKNIRIKDMQVKDIRFSNSGLILKR